jgi:hypothetical protein
MLNRYRHKKEGPYTKKELKEIYRVSHFLHQKFASGDKKISQLEKDYIKYCKNVFWHETRFTTLASCFTFLVIDAIYPINRLSFFPRLAIKITSASLIFKTGTNSALKVMLEFPLMDEVIGEAIIKYTDWINITE